MKQVEADAAIVWPVFKFLLIGTFLLHRAANLCSGMRQSGQLILIICRQYYRILFLILCVQLTPESSSYAVSQQQENTFFLNLVTPRGLSRFVCSLRILEKRGANAMGVSTLESGGSDFFKPLQAVSEAFL